ncbi:helix-turn-helix domain-containing protein [uncultured Brevundimonas sp.]|uniref:helix-turn-helix domain-containing protein n=1 Tax=uncultured Brevundimonas sp. TaxID=213418 RepID=UPI00261EE236|nr:helix-turn-helix domain-containing protein [uncultured Brevundimonas sp.]
MDAGERTALEAEVGRLRDVGVMGRSGTMVRLFDFIADRTLSGTRPNEAEIAVEVFGRSGSFEAGQDAVVRVYVHRLRKRLDDYYVRHPVERRLTVPRGEYRFTLESGAVPSSPAKMPSLWVSSWPKWVPAGIAACALLAGLAGGYVLGEGHHRATDAFTRSAVWAAYRKADRPLMIVVGDYYIYGETDHIGNVQRLVREFDINSREDLYEHMMLAEDSVEGAVDLNLAYLPISVAEALRALSPLIGQRSNVRLIMASDFTPRMLRDNDVIYVGYISGLHALEPITFRDGRFQVGSSYDELTDRQTGKRYQSDSARAGAPGGDNREFGYFTSVIGPKGNRLTVLAGTRDAGLIGVAQAVTDASVIGKVKLADGGVEMIVEASGKDFMGLVPKVVAEAPRNGQPAWPAN